MTARGWKANVVLLVAQGFGSGRVPVAPGTFGSVAGLVWFAILLWAGNPWLFLAGGLGGIGASVWLCGAAEKILNQRDPGSIVIDEIISIPLCFLTWLLTVWLREGVWLSLGYFFAGPGVAGLIGIFLLFRLFDVWKPWPIRPSQNLPGGWGVTIDDVLAAMAVNAVVGVILLVK